MKIYHNRCWDNHIKIVEEGEKLWKEYDFLLDTETMKTAHWENLWEFDEVSFILTKLIEKWLDIRILDDTRVCYVVKRRNYYVLQWPFVESVIYPLRDILLKKELRDFVMKNKRNNKNFLKDRNDLYEMILSIYNGTPDLEYIVKNYIKLN
jgi:hypothetical protein